PTPPLCPYTTLFRSQPGTTVPGDVGPRPLEQHQEAVAEPDQEHDVDEKPGEPGDEPGELESSDDRHRGRAPDGRHAPFVAVTERAGRLTAESPQHVVRHHAS